MKQILSFSDVDNNKIIKNINYLTDVIPPDKVFLHRVNEGNEITIKLRPILRSQRATNFFIYGLRGTGKTALMLFKLQELNDYCENKKIKFDYTYTNCGSQGLNNEVNVMIDILKQLDPNVTLAKAGLTKNYVRTTFEDLLLSKKIKNLVLVLDEFDALLLGASGDSILYYLSRIKDGKKFQDINLTTVIISNESKVKHFIMERTRSSFGRDRIDFFQYNATQLYDILKVRSKLAFQPGVISDGVLSKISAIVASRDGDCRKALEILAKCGTLALYKGLNKVTMNLVDEANAFLDQDLFLKTIKNMTKYQKILFLSLLANVLRGKPFTYYIFRTNNKICEMLDKEPLIVRNLQNFMIFFEEASLIESVTRFEKSIKRKTKHVRLLFDKKIQDQSLKILFTDLGLDPKDIDHADLKDYLK